MACRALGLFVSLAIVAWAVPAAASTEAPSLRIGDFWTYATNTTAPEGFYLRGDATFRIDAVETLSRNATDHRAFRVTVRGDGAAGGEVEFDGVRLSVSGNWTLTGEEFLDSTSLKILSSFLDLRATGRTDLFGQAFTLRLQNETSFAVLDDSWRFPIDVGDEGHLTEWFESNEQFLARAGFYGRSYNENTSGVRTLRYRLEARTTEQVPAGMFDSYRINETFPDGRFVHLHFSPIAGNNVRSESYNETGVQVASTELVAFRYQALEPPTFLGLGVVPWAAIVGALVAVTLGLVLRRRRRRTGVRGSPP